MQEKKCNKSKQKKKEHVTLVYNKNNCIFNKKKYNMNLKLE